MNLIEQMNVLKGLDDQMLQREVSTPSGAVPPFLVLSEMNRRKDMRDRYMGEMARRRPQTTVAQDVMAGMGTPQQAPMMDAMPSMAGPAGIAAAASAPDQPQGFADGGIVNYADIARKYQEQLDNAETDRKRAAALALIAAGAGIMGGGHSNTLQNVGLGIDAGVKSYGDALTSIDARDRALLGDLTDLGQAQHADALAQQDQAYRDLQTKKLQQEIDQNTPEYWRTVGAAQGLSGTELDRYASSLGQIKPNQYAPTVTTGLDENGNEVTARFNKTTGDYEPNPRADGSIPQSFTPYSSTDLAQKKIDQKQMADKTKALPQDAFAVQNSLRQSATAMDTIKRAYEKLNWTNTGMVGAISGVLPGGGWAQDARALVKTLQSDLAQQTLQAMRDASKTGGALGNVSDKDLELLQTKIANLDPNQSEDQLKENLKVIYNELNDALALRVNLFNQQYQGVPGAESAQFSMPPAFEDAMSAPTADPMDSLVDKYRTQAQ